MYADDTALVFPTREDTALAILLIYPHFLRWGMEIHKGRTGSVKPSKSVAMYCAASRASHNPGLSPFYFGENGEFEVPVVEMFKYLGSCVSRDCNEATEVDNRIVSEGNAFEALSKCVFRAKTMSLRAKRVVYNGLILAILLYGAETWSLSEVLFNRVRTFHAQCVRTMCLVKKRQI